jgi:hypothetical protein
VREFGDGSKVSLATPHIKRIYRCVGERDQHFFLRSDWSWHFFDTERAAELVKTNRTHDKNGNVFYEVLLTCLS